MLFGTVLAASDNKDGVKTKRAYSLGYGYAPYPTYYEHDFINHVPIAPTVVAHDPVTEFHHAPTVVAHSPVIAHAPLVTHAPVISAVAPVSKITSSVISTNVHHYPGSFYAPPARIIASAPYYHAPAYAASSYTAPSYTASYVAPAYAHSPLVAEFHRR